MNDLVILIIAALILSAGLAVIVSGARSNVGTASQRIWTIIAGFVLTMVGLISFAFGPKQGGVTETAPFVVGALLVGVTLGLAWGNVGKGAQRRH